MEQLMFCVDYLLFFNAIRCNSICAEVYSESDIMITSFGCVAKTQNADFNLNILRTENGTNIKRNLSIITGDGYVGV